MRLHCLVPGCSEPRGGLVFPCALPGVSRLLGMAVALLRAPRCGLGCKWAALGAGPSTTGPWTLECFLPRSGVAGLGSAAPLLGSPPPPLLALLAAAAGALAARPIRSLCVQRTETKQNKLVSWPEQRHTRRGGALQCGSLPVSPSQGSWLSAATSCRLLFYIWYLEKSMMTVNGVRGRGGALGLPGATAAAAGAAGCFLRMTIPYVGLSDRREPQCPPAALLPARPAGSSRGRQSSAFKSQAGGGPMPGGGRPLGAHAHGCVPP